MLGRSASEQIAATSVAAGAASGVVGGTLFDLQYEVDVRTEYYLACLGNPLFLIKARMQVS